jgi:hypothetical protein
MSPSPDRYDPRSEAEKARADLKRNTEMDMAIPMSPAERRPSVTPETFGERTDPATKVRSTASSATIPYPGRPEPTAPFRSMDNKR